MANLLLIEKQTGGYFKFTLNGDTANAVTSIYNDLLTVGNQLHFKTGNGANIIKEQFIYPEDVTVVASGTFTFTTVAQVWDKLIDIDYFAWLGNGGGGGGVDRFDDLVDTFKYTGNAGKTVIVDNSELRLVPVTLYNKRLFTELEDTPSSLVPNKMLVVNPAGTAVVLQDQPQAPEALLNSVGYFDYNDLITQTTPLNAVANVALKLTNDTEGANTSTDQNPYGVSYVWDYTTNQFNFSELSVGDTIDVRIHVQITTTSANQKVTMSAKFGIGSVSEFTNAIYENQFKSSGLHEVSFVAPFYMGSEYITDYPCELYLTTDASATVKVDGWYVRILRKNINLITVDYAVPDATTLAKGIVRLAGDLAGTANSPTVPELANKVPNTRTISTTSPLLGGGDLSSNLTLSIQQANSTQSGFISYVDWSNFEAKQSALSGSGFVKVSGSTVSYDNNVYSLDSDVVKLTGNQTIDGIKTFTDYTKFTDSSATGGLWAVEIDVNSNDALVVKDGGTVRFQIGRNGEALGQKYKVSGGFSNQFLKANGDLDSNTYALDSGVVKLTGNQTIAGEKKFQNTQRIDSETLFKQNASYVFEDGYTTIAGRTNGILISHSLSKAAVLDLSGLTTPTKTFSFPNASGTFALTSDLSSYALDNSVVKLTGDQTVAGIKTFTSDVKSTAFRLTGGTSGTGLYYGHTNKVVLANYTVGGGIDFETNGGSLSMILNGNGNLGIGVDPSAWDSLWKVLQLSYGSLYSSIYSNVMAHNLYVAGEDTKYISSNFATQYEQNSGAHWWYTAPTGTAGVNMTLTPRMILTNDGKLGIGITGPEGKLTVSGTSAQPPTSGTTANSLLQLKGSLNNELNIGCNTAAGGYGSYIQASDNNLAVPYSLNLQPNGGNVGIGTTSPSKSLEIFKSGFATAQFKIGDSSTSKGYIGTFSNSLYINAGGTFDSGWSTDGANGIAGIILETSNGGSAIAFGTANSNTSPSERMRITSTGAVGIGTAPSHRLHVATASSDWGTVFTNNSKSTVYAAHGDGYGLAVDTIANTWSLYTFKVAGGNGTTAGTNEYFKISGTGALYSAPTYSNTSGSGANLGIASDGFFYRSTSSLKYKKNVENYEKGLDVIMQMRPVTYNSINESEEGIQYAGLIAEEIHDLGLTEFVQYADDGTPDALAYSNMVSLLVKGIQEQNIMLQELKAEIELLKAK